MLLCSPDWSFTGLEQARQADFGGEWQGMVEEQTSEPVSAAEEVGPQVARRHAWVGALAVVRCQQWHFLTMAIHKQASQQRCSVLGEWRTGHERILQHTQAKEEETYGSAYTWIHALNMTHTLSHKHTNKDLILFLLTHIHTPPLKLICCWEQAGLNWGEQSRSGVLTEHHCQEFHRGGARVGNHSTCLCGLKPGRQWQSPAPASGAQHQEV